MESVDDEEKRFLKELIEEIVQGVVNDCKTFFKAKCCGVVIGGGNLLMNLGAFATLNLLGKTYSF